MQKCYRDFDGDYVDSMGYCGYFNNIAFQSARMKYLSIYLCLFTFLS